MRFHVIQSQKSNSAQSPIRVVEHESGREVGWVNRYLDREYVRRLADTTLRAFAYSLLHFIRWWESIHHTAEVVERDVSESTLLEYLKFQSKHEPRVASTTINFRIGVADRALRNEFPDAPMQMAQGFQRCYVRRGPLGLGRRRRPEPVASESAQASDRAALGGRGRALLVQFPHGSGLGHRGNHASARTALGRSAGVE